jgi:choice-of-anchor B domain-containing protein
MKKNLYTSLAALLVFSFSIKAQYSNQNINLLGHWYNPSELAEPSYGIKYNGCWAWVDTAHGMAEYAIVGSTSGTHIVDISNPGTPIERDFVPGRRSQCIWREYKTYGKYLYAISDDGAPNSFQIMDLSYLPDSVHVIHDGTTYFERSHTLYVDGDKLYCGSVTYPGAGGHYSMIVYSLANPANPTLLRKLNDDDNTINHVHDMFVRNDTVYASCGYQGLYIYKFNTGTNTFSAINSLTSYPGQGYNHSSFLTQNGKYLAFADEVPANMPLKIIDVSDLQNISVESTFKSNEGATPHNPYIIGNKRLIVAYYQDGLQIFDISNPTAPVRSGFFDTDTLAGLNTNYTGFTPYHGNWGAYTELPSGNIIANDMQNGLFILDASVALGINEKFNSENNFTVFPNPTAETLYITYNIKKNQNLVLELIDITGKRVKSEKITGAIGNNTIALQTEEFGTGIYLLKISGDDVNYSQKIIKR